MRWAILVAALVLVTGPASAGPPPDEARVAYDAGSSEYDLGHYKDALRDFEKAFRLRRLPALLFNIAQCHRMLGEMKEAATVYRSFISKDPDNPRVQGARELLAQVEAALARQAEAQSAKPTEVSTRQEPTASAELTPPDPVPARAPVVAARPTVVPPPAQAPAEELPLVEAPRAIRFATSKPIAEPPVARWTEPAPPAPAKRPRVWTWVAAGGAAAAAGVGVALGARSSSTAASLRDTLHSGAEVQALQSDHIADAQRANAFFVTAGILAAAGVAFFVLEF